MKRKTVFFVTTMSILAGLIVMLATIVIKPAALAIILLGILFFSVFLIDSVSPPITSHTSRPNAFIGVAIISLAIFSLIIIQYQLNRSVLSNFVLDDSFITYRYAANFASGMGLTFNPGEYVEGYSNLLWVLIVSIGSAIGYDPVIFSKVAAVLCSAATLLVMYRLYLLKTNFGLLAYIVSCVCFLFATHFHLWSLLGLENSLLAFLLLAGMVTSMSGPTISSLLVILLIVLTRVDGVIYIPALIIIMKMHEKNGNNRWITRRLFLVIFLVMVEITAYHLWRYTYYGSFVPTTGQTKFPVNQIIRSMAHINFDSIMSVLKLILLYLREGIRQEWAYFVYPNLAFLVIIVSAIARKKPFLTLMPGALIIVTHLMWWSLFGWDWAPGRRYTPIIPVLAIMSGEAISICFYSMSKYLNQNSGIDKRGAIGMGLLVIIVSFGLLNVSLFDLNVTARNPFFSSHTRSMVQRATLGMFIAALIKGEDESKMKLAAAGEGAAPYYSGLVTITRFGLANKKLAAAQVSGHGHGAILPYQLWLQSRPEFITTDPPHTHPSEALLLKAISSDYTRVELRSFDITKDWTNWLFIRNDILKKYADRMQTIKDRDSVTDFNAFEFDYRKFVSYFKLI